MLRSDVKAQDFDAIVAAYQVAEYVQSPVDQMQQCQLTLAMIDEYREKHGFLLGFSYEQDERDMVIKNKVPCLEEILALAQRKLDEAADEARTQRALLRLREYCKKKQAAEAALSLAKNAGTQNEHQLYNMRFQAQEAIRLYKECNDMRPYHREIKEQIQIAEKISALAQRELDKPLLLRWCETLVQLLISG